jgi:hypothetical protein
MIAETVRIGSYALFYTPPAIFSGAGAQVYIVNIVKNAKKARALEIIGLKIFVATR